MYLKAGIYFFCFSFSKGKRKNAHHKYVQKDVACIIDSGGCRKNGMPAYVGQGRGS